MVVTFPHPEVTSRYFFGSPWIPELMFVAGKLDPEVLRLYHQERQEAHMNNQALYTMTYEEKHLLVYSNSGIQTESSGPFTPDPPCQLNVLGHNGHPLGMDGLT